MNKLVGLGLFILSFTVTASDSSDKEAIKRAALDYIESQHQVKPELMQRGVHPELKKRTYWKGKDKKEFVMETSYDFMVGLAGRYNKQGDKFPKQPQKDVVIYDIDQRVASVKLIADEWIDYMHLMKMENGDWKVINVLWQYKEVNRHKSK
ncbi:MAG: nuclear transport factor 2 family protein [Kangiellaceae bacterium]|nr:nuclear transport factor 2 family protein [Kangiellaceae bacterium]MCW8999093.1 nuclear transport factor 2 family protein [Kangiellaceae bacterium]